MKTPADPLEMFSKTSKLTVTGRFSWSSTRRAQELLVDDIQKPRSAVCFFPVSLEASGVVPKKRDIAVAREWTMHQDAHSSSNFSFSVYCGSGPHCSLMQCLALVPHMNRHRESALVVYAPQVQDRHIGSWPKAAGWSEACWCSGS